MNGFAALCAFIATFSPPLGEVPFAQRQEIAPTTNEPNHLQMQDARIEGPRIQGVIYFDGPIPNRSQRILR